MRQAGKLSRLWIISAVPLVLIGSSRCSGSAESEQVRPEYEIQAEADAKEDREVVVFDGMEINELACDTTIRKMPDGSWVTIMLGGGPTEPLPTNRVFLGRSLDEGKTWSAMTPIDLGVKSKDPNRAIVPSELMVYGGRVTMFVAVHDGSFGEWRSKYTVSEDSGRTWGPLKPIPEKIHTSTFVRNHIVTRGGELVLPFQHYLAPKGPVNPRNGVMISNDGGQTYEAHGWIRISDDDEYRGWAEPNVVELADGTLVMMIRADKLGGVLFRADSTDGGKTWSEAYPTDIPNPGSKVRLLALGENRVALLHNPDPKVRNPLSLWVSFDGMETWPYRRDLVRTSGEPHEHEDGTVHTGQSHRGVCYPDGFLSEDGRYLHFGFDHMRHRAVYYGAKLPEVK